MLNGNQCQGEIKQRRGTECLKINKIRDGLTKELNLSRTLKVMSKNSAQGKLSSHLEQQVQRP